MIRVWFAGVVVCALCGLSVTSAEGGDVVSGPCACAAGTVLIDGECSAEFECRWYCMADQAEVTSSGERKDREKATLDCDNCDDCETMRCVESLCVTETDSGSVSGTAAFSAALKGDINLALAGTIGIETTTEFEIGLTTTTTVSKERCIECGGPAISACAHVKYHICAFGTPHTAQVPLGHQWYVRVTCPGDTDPQWVEHNKCLTPKGSATITGEVGTHSGCEAHQIPCPSCPCEPPDPGAGGDIT